MRKVLFAVAVFAVASFAQANNTVRDIQDVDFRGSESCIMYYAQTESNNLAVLCDGNALLMMDAPKKEVLGKKATKAVKDAYQKITVEKCYAANLKTLKIIDNADFFGVLCHK